MLIVEMMSSRPDRAGGVYHAICVTNKNLNKTASATVTANNTESALRHLFGDWEAKRKYSHCVEQVHNIRAFNQIVKGLPYAGCTPEDIAAWIVANVGPVEGAKL